MTARVLVVDDIPANVKLLEAKLLREYFEVLTAQSGAEALEKIADGQPDIVLLDVMMPGMDGFEVCRRIKADPRVAHVPVVMVTALDQPEDRVKGLSSGADDFLTKPVEDVALLARVRSLVRIKTMIDELRMRAFTGRNLGLAEDEAALLVPDTPGRIVLAEDRAASQARIVDALKKAGHSVTVVADAAETPQRVASEQADLAMISLALNGVDGLRLCSQIRSGAATRGVPILVVTDPGGGDAVNRALEIGATDYLSRPVDVNELAARVRTQLRRKRYTDRLRQTLELSVEMAVKDQLTGLFNRRYMERHLSGHLERARDSGKPVSFLVLDIDYFKAINDGHGHDIGDEVLREFARRVSANVRGLDLACRFGGEEFVVVMPDTDMAYAFTVAERLRQSVAGERFAISQPPGSLEVTVSIGIAASMGPADTGEGLLRRADQALYRAKRDGRNRVVVTEAAAA